MGFGITGVCTGVVPVPASRAARQVHGGAIGTSLPPSSPPPSVPRFPYLSVSPSVLAWLGVGSERAIMLKTYPYRCRLSKPKAEAGSDLNNSY